MHGPLQTNLARGNQPIPVLRLIIVVVWTMVASTVRQIRNGYRYRAAVSLGLPVMFPGRVILPCLTDAYTSSKKNLLILYLPSWDTPLWCASAILTEDFTSWKGTIRGYIFCVRGRCPAMPMSVLRIVSINLNSSLSGSLI
ncbi:hypothetical protein GJ744_000217 [Endocarpon pusillum]|uniref:Uncharacterized protein n=1 Tax=Endocarpon pusillum TaxID=364733 RepID=A0A8H7AWZ8_9EURO|nr:hypothetical protein GJ744_000217 [Endocarpon pusillum]